MSSVCRSSVETVLVAISAIVYHGGNKMHGRGFKPRPDQDSGSGHVDFPKKAPVEIELFSRVKAFICCKKLAQLLTT